MSKEVSKKIEIKPPSKPASAVTMEQDENKNHDFDAELRRKQFYDDLLSPFNRKFFKWAWRFSIAFLIILFFIILPIREMNLIYFQKQQFSFILVLRFIQEWSRAFVDSARTVGVGILALIVSDTLKRFIYRKEK